MKTKQIEVIRQQLTQLLDAIEAGSEMQQIECIGACAISLNTLANMYNQAYEPFNCIDLVDCIKAEQKRLERLNRASVAHADNCLISLSDTK